MFDVKRVAKIVIDFFGSTITTIGFLQRYKIQSGDIVIDAGAYLGYFTLVAAKKVGPKGLVVAFEPSPANFKILSDRVRNANLQNVVLINKALYNEETELFFTTNITSKSVSKEDKDSKNILKVKANTIDNELAALNIKQVDFIKMDIEGAEIETIMGGQKTFKKTKNFAIACYHKRENKTTGEIMTPLFKKMGFKAEVGFFLHPTMYGFRN